MLLGQSSPCSRAHLPGAVLASAGPAAALLPAVSAGAPRPSGRCCGQQSSLEPQIPNWLPAALQAAPTSPWVCLEAAAALSPAALAAHSRLGTGQPCPEPPECAGQPGAEALKSKFQYVPAASLPVLRGSTGASAGWPISGNVSVCRAVSLGNFVACSLFPSFSSPEASQSCAVLQLKCATARRAPWDAESRFVAS